MTGDRSVDVGTLRRLSLLAFLLPCLLAGCLTAPRVQFEAADQSKAVVEDLPAVRFWADSSNVGIASDTAEAAGGDRPPQRPLTILALSGGGSGGAFGAGVLAGWSASGERPVFDVVTGVSAGALLAPFAFLGSAHDGDMTRLTTGGTAEDLFDMRDPIHAVFGTSLLDGGPLARLIARQIDAPLLAKIAAAHQAGRRLFVLTTNLDAQRPVVWDMGAIAASGSPRALALFRDVLRASASIPGVYPAVPIDVVADGRRFEELHVDGGTSSQLFVLPRDLLARTSEAPSPIPEGSKIYVVVNNAIDPEFSLTSNRTFPVIGRAYATLIKAHTRATVDSAYVWAASAGVDFNLLALDEAVPYSLSDPFDGDYMRRLHEIGFRHGVRTDWASGPDMVAASPVRPPAPAAP